MGSEHCREPHRPPAWYCTLCPVLRWLIYMRVVVSVCCICMSLMVQK